MGQPSSASTGSARARRRMEPARRRLLLASGMGVFGGLLPWVMTGVGNVSGVRGGGLWVAYAAMLALAGALIPKRRLAAVQGALLAVAGVVLPLWQVLHLLRLVGTAGWLPGPGLVLSFGAGVLAAVASVALFQPVDAPS